MPINLNVNLDDKEAQEKLKQLQNGKYNIDVGVNGNKVDETTQSMNKLTSATKNTNSVFGKLRNTISDTFSTGKLAMTGYLAVLNEIRKASKNASQAIEDVDKAITDLSIASGMTREATAGLVKDYNKFAQDLKSTTTEVTSAADDWLRAGKKMSEAKDLIQDSVMLSKLGQISSSEATEDLLATMNGYNMSAEELRKALDAMVAIDFQAATSSGDLATGLKYSASSAASAEVSFNKLVAILGTVQDRTQQSAEVVGTFANTMLSRYRDVTIGKYLSDDGEDISNYESVLKSVGIQLRDQQGEFRDFETVLQEMADKWSSLTSVQQNALIKVAAGTRQQNRFIALMENYNKVLELTEVAANSAGTAVDKFNNSYANSLEAKKNTLQATFESMVINSDFDEVYADILDATTALVKFVDESNALKGAFTGLATMGGIKGFLAIRTGINEAYISLNQFQNALNIAKQTTISTDGFDKLLLLSKNLSQSQMKLLLSSKNLTNVQREQILINSGLSKEESKLILESYGLTTAQTGLTAATTSLKNAAMGLWNTLIANPFVLITAAVSATVMAYSSYKQKLEETRKANIEAADSASETAENLREVYVQYDRLSKITDKTTDQEEEYKTVIENITSILGDRAEALKGLTAGTQEYTNTLRELTKAELEEQYTSAVVGRKSAEEEFQNDIWSSVKGSKVSVDSNSSGKSLSNEAQKAVDIVSVALGEYETINRTWKNISWDITSDDPEQAVDYYNSLIKARELLVARSKDDESLLDTEIYKDINNAINAMSDSMDTYISKKYEELKLDYMVQNGIPTTTKEYQAMEESMKNATATSQGLQSSIMDLLAQDFSDISTDVDISVSVNGVEKTDITQITSTISTSVQQIKDQLSSAFKELGDAYQNIFTENGFSIDDVDNDMLSGIKSAFEELEGFDTSNLDKFFDTLTNSASTADQVQQAFNDLATAYFYSTDTLNNLNDATAESIEQQLEEMGVANAHEVVYDALNGKMQALALQKQFATQTGYDLINATSEEAIAFLNEAGASETARGYLLLLIAQEQIFSNQDLNVEQKIQKLQQLAAEYGNTALAASVAAKMEEATKSAATGGSYSFQDAFNDAKTEFEKAATTVNIDFKSIGGGSKSAGSAGKEAGDAYVEAYEKELEKLQTARDRGEITEAEYLSRMKALYEKYFGGISKYQDKYFEEQRKYLEGMESLYNSALSGITKLMGNKIDLYNEEKETVISNLQEEKDAAIDALEAQKKAAEEAYQAQIDAIQEKIDALEKEKKANQDIIDGIQDEIDAIQDAADSRKRELTLMKAQYELERARNQRTILQYDEKSGMHYVKDDSAERDAKEKVDDANREIQIAELEKQIDYYEKLNDAIDDTIEGYEDQIDAIQKLLDESNKYYDDLIEQTEKSYDAQIKSMEKYYDSLIKSMENQKSKWEELAEVKDIADAYSSVKQVFGELGYTVEDVLNGNEQAFEDFKAKYIGLMNDMNSNTTFAEGLSYASDVAQENLGSFLDSTQKAADGLDSLGEKADTVDGIATSMSNASTSASELSNSTDGLGENLSGISDSLNNIPDSEQFSGLVTQFSNLGEAIQSVADALGIGAEDTVGGLVGALQSLSTFSLGDEENGLVAQFNQLAEAATNVATAIGGGGGGGADASAGGDGSTSKSPSMGAGANGGESNGSSNSITGALDSLKAKADEVLGEGSEDSEDGEGVIGQFGQLKTAVDDVTTAIGISEEGSDGGSGQEGDESTLTGAITGLKTTTEEVMGESGGEGVIGKFEKFRDVLGEANAHVTGISDGLEAIDGQEVECTIKINIETNGSIPHFAEGTVLGKMNLSSAEYKAKYGSAHVAGTANVQGNWGAHEAGKSLVGEEGQELWVHRGTGKFETVGDRGAEFINVQKGDLIFNHEQTKQLLRDGHISSRGKAYANGTVNKPSVLDRLRAQGYEVQKYEWKDMYGNLISPQQMNEAAKAWVSGTYECLTPMNDFKEKIKETVKVIEGANVVNNTMNQQPINQTFNITMPNVTDSTSANVLMRDLQSISTKKLQYNWKK